ncbi:2,5-didehydrogluconate reductase DkgA [Pectobacterium atrosepticum]|uniref:2,5-didehydrogluconate reductase DkgA n=1 Tax=Pectobacterium atrosepticum TaxID=29471 RepID=UPI00301A33AF
MTQPKVKLADGNIMPQLGLGVWRASSEDTVIAVTEALSIGYRAIDTAAIYKNEEAVGQALSSANLPREEVFITTKLWNGDHTDPQKALEESLRKLQLDHVDLYLIHWPLPQQNTFVDAWRGLIKLQEQGLAKSIGVSNFHIHHLQQLKEETGILPVIDQVELHPLLQQKQLHAWNATHHIQTESWSPLAQGGEGVFDHPIIRKLAMKYGKTPAQIVIRWHLDCGLVVIPKSVTPARIKENFEVFDFRLDKDELGDIAKLDCGKRLGSDPDEPRND